MDEKQLIAQNATEINRLTNLIKDSNSSKTRATWQSATAQFHASYPILFYPGGEERLKALRLCDETAVGTALNYLEVDPYHFRSGYTKEYIWKYIVRCPLTIQDMDRLCGVALHHLEQPLRREFWPMCRAMTRLASADFWSHVEMQLDSNNLAVRTRAYYLYAYSQGVDLGERVRRQARRERIHREIDSN